MQTNHSNNSVVNEQSGIGDEFGLAENIGSGRSPFFINPYLKRFSVIPFSGSESNTLSETGIKFGLGYNF
jgi:hypothetical protein